MKLVVSDSRSELVFMDSHPVGRIHAQVHMDAIHGRVAEWKKPLLVCQLTWYYLTETNSNNEPLFLTPDEDQCMIPTRFTRQLSFDS